jgi:hypothetical protein
MKRFNDSGRQPQPLPRRRRAISAGAGILLIAIGAVLRFALTVGSPLGLNVHTVGVILILAGVVGLVLPGSARARLYPGWLRTRWISSGQAQPYPRPAASDAGGYDDRPAAAEDLPDFEYDPPS